MALKIIEVDEKIAPVVKWLNSFNGIITIYSCHGNKRRTTDCYEPYVLFICKFEDELVEILDIIRDYLQKDDISKSYIRVEVDHYDLYEPVRYCIRFYDQKELLKFCKYLKSC